MCQRKKKIKIPLMKTTLPNRIHYTTLIIISVLKMIHKTIFKIQNLKIKIIEDKFNLPSLNPIFRGILEVSSQHIDECVRLRKLYLVKFIAVLLFIGWHNTHEHAPDQNLTLILSKLSRFPNDLSSQKLKLL